jgi:hypothetical protein
MADERCAALAIDSTMAELALAMPFGTW